jgi:3' terminal RNA ribose 2'-O-methyltransferase Hen1
VNDRPYAASSFLSVAIAKLFGTALTGRCKDRPELAELAIPLQVGLPGVPVRGGEAVLRRLFEPLGYAVTAAPIALDPQFPEWGDSRYLSVTMSATLRLREALEQLFVLLPVLDDDKHYWVGPDEVDKLLRRGGQWLAAHPDAELIAHRYLRHDRRLASDALARLLEDDACDPDQAVQEQDAREEAAERRVGLHEQRLDAVTGLIRSSGARTVLDLGCGGGKLMAALLKEHGLDRIVGMDVSYRPWRSRHGGSGWTSWRPARGAGSSCCMAR